MRMVEALIEVMDCLNEMGNFFSYTSLMGACRQKYGFILVKICSEYVKISSSFPHPPFLFQGLPKSNGKCMGEGKRIETNHSR